MIDGQIRDECSNVSENLEDKYHNEADTDKVVLHAGSAQYIKSNVAKGTDIHVADSLAIGIDLGTSNCCVAVFRLGEVEIIKSDKGHETIPSCVFFFDKDMYFGDCARERGINNPDQMVFGIKRMMGRKFNDSCLQSDIKKWPFKVVNDKHSPKVEVHIENKATTFTPAEISSKILTHMKKMAEAYLKHNITKVVISVPSCFNFTQRNATIEAGRLAGLDILRIINGTSAAALAYSLKNGVQLGDLHTILVYDLGGGTLDVSIMTVHQNGFKVKAVAGDMHLGGDDFDNNLVDYIVKKCKKKRSIEISKKPEVIAKVKLECERAKHKLSTEQCAEITVDFLEDPMNFNITRARFEKLNEKLFSKALDPVISALRDAKLEEKDINEIILVGRSSNIPKIHNILQEHFKAVKIINISTKHPVACGAAVQAAILLNDHSLKIPNLHILDVSPSSLFVKVRKGESSNLIIKHNSVIPFNIPSVTYKTTKKNQERMTLKFVEKHSKFGDKNVIGLINVDPSIQEMGTFSANMTGCIDENGVLTAEVRRSEHQEDYSGRQTMKLKPQSRPLSKIEVKCRASLSKGVEDQQKPKSRKGYIRNIILISAIIVVIAVYFLICRLAGILCISVSVSMKNP